MVASHNDSYQLSQSAGFQTRVFQSVLTFCVEVSQSEQANTTPFHRERFRYAQTILTTSTQTALQQQFASGVSTDANCLSDATQNGTVALTPANRDTQGGLVTDAHIDAAVSSQFNAYVPGIAG
jgi:hypothetical protein